ncbi:MAG: metalloregulator ArsR/SmtB family transcription factor [Bdellovibrionota bacterium]
MVESSTYDLDYIFQALSDPTRRSILRKIAKRERAITEVAESYSMSLAAVSKHIQSLERARLVTRRKEGSYSYISLNADAMSSADKWIQYYRGFWEGNLKSLKNFIENEDK